MNGAPHLSVHALNNLRRTVNTVNRTNINRKRCPDTGIEPETSDRPGKRSIRYTTRTSTYFYALSYYKYTGKHNDASSKM